MSRNFIWEASIEDVFTKNNEHPIVKHSLAKTHSWSMPEHVRLKHVVNELIDDMKMQEAVIEDNKDMDDDGPYVVAMHTEVISLYLYSVDNCGEAVWAEDKDSAIEFPDRKKAHNMAVYVGHPNLTVEEAL